MNNGRRRKASIFGGRVSNALGSSVAEKNGLRGGRWLWISHVRLAIRDACHVNFWGQKVDVGLVNVEYTYTSIVVFREFLPLP